MLVVAEVASFFLMTNSLFLDFYTDHYLYFFTIFFFFRITEEGRPLIYIYVGRIRVHSSKVSGIEFGYDEGIEVKKTNESQSIKQFLF